jgi:hypothetical protein
MGVKPELLTPRVEHSLKVFKNRVQRRMFGAKTEEVTGGEK